METQAAKSALIDTQLQAADPSTSVSVPSGSSRQSGLDVARLENSQSRYALSQFADDYRTQRPISAGHAPLPLIISPQNECDIMALHDPDNAVDGITVAQLNDLLQQHGGLLFRGFQVRSALAFRKFAAAFGAPLLEYTYASTPRSKVVSGVYSSTEYPPHQTIPLHNEQAYTREWPATIWFHSLLAASSGGETPIADSRVVYQRLPAELRERWIQRELLYVRNYGPALDLPWQQVFNTEDRSAVEAYCDQHGIEWEWRGSDELRTQQRCQAAIQHPHSGDWVWFNQAHLFHASALADDVRQSLLSAVGEANLPRHVYFGDGEAIPDAELAAIRAVYDQSQISFPWQQGDVLMLDNRLVAHGRKPFTGERKVIVAMA